MSIVRPFRAWRPRAELAEQVASPPYDVVNTEEARELARGNPLSFLHVNKPEIDLPAETNAYDESVYAQGRKNLDKLIDDGVFIQEEKPAFYLYRQIMNEHIQIGLVACVSSEEYKQDKIKKHELTRIEKEDDRLNHILSLNAQTGPVFLTYRAEKSLDDLISAASSGEPEYDFKSDDGILHTLWTITDNETITKIESGFADIGELYVADGHHRSAAASRVSDVLKEKNSSHSGEEEYNYFLSVIFPDNQMYIMDYNRVVKDLNGLSEKDFIKEIGKKFLVREFARSEGYRPKVRHDYGMYLNGMWYRLSAIPGSWDNNHPTKRLDVSILTDNLLKPILGIGDLRKDKRIDFVGGMRGIEGLEARVDTGEMSVAFTLYPTSIEDLLATADAGETMPPKSTWFEPKLRSGLIIHSLE